MPDKDEIKKLKEACRIETPIFRVGFPNLFQAKAVMGSEKKKFSVQMMFAKDSDLTSVKKAIASAKTLKWGQKEEWPKNLEPIVYNGDDEAFKDREGYQKCWVIKASAEIDRPPTVVFTEKDENGKFIRVTNPADLYPGCFARAIVFAFAWEKVGKKGVSFGLDHIQKIKDGSVFGGKKAAEDSFSPLAIDDDETEDSDNEDADIF